MPPTKITSAEELGTRIRAKRKQAGLTQQKAAALAGIGARFLSELERGKPTVELGKTLKVMSLLGMELLLNDRS